MAKKTGDATPKKAHAPRAKKSAEIKPGEPAKIVDQETQVTPVQKLSDAQLDHTETLPGSVIVDPEVKHDPVHAEPVKDEKAESSIEQPNDNGDVLTGEAKEFNAADEKKFAKGTLKSDDEDKEETHPHDGSVLDQNVDEIKFDEKTEKKLANLDAEPVDPTRYGNFKEVPLDHIENPGDARHNDSAVNAEFITGRKNEYPR